MSAEIDSWDLLCEKMLYAELNSNSALLEFERSMGAKSSAASHGEPKARASSPW